ncbi:nucleotidyl transferase AbiEii/AbiGii toxin family protein [Bacteroidota bacterium]
MFDINRHRFYLVQILKDIYSDLELANYLGFKGGTALMFFYDLPRFSVDLDFDLLDVEKEDSVYEKLRKIVLKYGRIFDEAKKFHGPLLVLGYGTGERKLKIEISKRMFDNKYELKNLFGFNVKVMKESDMFAHKLCALLDRSSVTNRDIFDTWFFLSRQTPLNKTIIETRMSVSLEVHLDNCINALDALNSKTILDGLGELMNAETKQFVRTKLLFETISQLQFYRKFPILSE